MDADALLARLPRTHYIDGAWTDDETSLAVENPATGRTLTHVADASPEVAMAALDAAVAAQASWAATEPRVRGELLRAAYERIVERADEFATVMTLEMGKPLAEARGEVTYGAEFFRWFAEEAVRVHGRYAVAPLGGSRLVTMKQPVGPVLAITPWNFPLAMGTRKIGPALAAGCTVVLKPAEQTPLSTIRLGELALEADIPEGVVNVVTGYGRTAGAMLASHMDVDKIAFTGSTQTGRAIIEASKTNFKRISLELGGKSPTFIFADADLKKAIPAAAMGIFFNAGQVCAAGSRLFVAEEVADQVLEGIAGTAKMLRVGHTLDPETIIGPLVSEVQLDRVTGYIESGRQEGATVLVGGGRKEGPGWFVEPTVLVDTEANMKVRREEIFGPVLCAHRFTDADDADRLARMGNETEFGLAASIWTRDIAIAHKLARRLKAGSIRINGSGGVDPALPLGGYKSSGWGRENGKAGIDAYTELKAVSVALD